MRASRNRQDDLSRLLDKRLLVMAGKGGVGKSTVAAVLALCGARMGKKVLCCEVNAKERIAPLLGARPSGPIIQEAVPSIFTVNVRPKDAMREYGVMKLRFESVYNVVFENRLVRHFVKLVPSLAETVMLGKVWYEVEAKKGSSHKWDLVILDAPATGHGVSLLGVPRVLLETVPPGPMREDAQRMQATLTDPSKTRVDLVTLPEEMPVNETADLERIVRTKLELPLGYVFLNGFVERRFGEHEVGDLLGVAERTPLGAKCIDSSGGPSSARPAEPACASRSSPAGAEDAPPRPAGAFRPAPPCTPSEPPRTHQASLQKPGTLHPAVAAAHAALHHASHAELSAFYEAKLAAQVPGLPRLKLPRIHASTWGRSQILVLSEILTRSLAGDRQPRLEAVGRPPRSHGRTAPR